MEDSDLFAANKRVTAHSYGALDTSDATSECWLIRLPAAIADVFEAAPEGTDLGRLVFRKGSSSTSSTSSSNGGTKTATQKNSAAVAASKSSISVRVNESLLKLVQSQAKSKPAPPPLSPPLSSSSATKNSKGTIRKLPSVLPLNYVIQAMTKKIPTMHPFIRNPTNGSVKILGIVSRTGNLQVIQDDNYRALLKDRLVTSAVNSSRFVKPTEATESIMSRSHVITAPVTLQQQQHQQQQQQNSNLLTRSSTPVTRISSSSFGNAISRVGKRIIEANEQSSSFQYQVDMQKNAAASSNHRNKRRRQFAPDQALRSVIFELFETQPYWTVKDLRLAAVAGGSSLANSKKGESEMRDILRDIGEYHRSGDHKNMWELKSEFQNKSH